MFKPIRVVATIIFLASIGMVFVGAFVLTNEVRSLLTAHSFVHLIAFVVSQILCLSSPRHFCDDCMLTVICVVLVIIEYLAFTWYSLSYIPYARSAVKRMVGFG